MTKLLWIKSLAKQLLKKENLPTILIFGLILVIILVNELHVAYPDEFESILGGYYIIHGRLPYTGFFAHHNPFAYFFAAPITAILGESLVRFRIGLGFVYFGLAIWFYRWIKSRFGFEEAKLTLAWVLFISVGATYWWGQMLLADTLSAYLLMVPFSILFWLFLKREPLRSKDIWIISIFSALTLLTTLTLIFAILVIYLFTLFWFIKNTKPKLVSWQTANFFGVLLVPYLIFGIYLLVTLSIIDFIYQSIIFNSKYYAELPDGASIKNPIRVALVLFNQFFFNFKTVLVMSKDLNFGAPFNQTLAVANFTLIVFLLLTRRFVLTSFVFLILIYSLIRSDPYNTKETDYHGMTYHLISIFNGIVVLRLLWDALKDNLNGAKRLIFSALILFLGVYFIFLGLYLFEKAFKKGYEKYMGRQSLVYDRPVLAPTLSKLVSKDDYYFIGPFDFEDHFYIKSKLASKYIVVIPAMDNSQKIQQEVLADLQKNSPKVLVFNTEYRIFGIEPGGFLKPFISKNYFNLEKLGAPCKDYKATMKWLGEYDFERHFYFKNDQKDQMIKKLLETKLIEKVDPSSIPAFCNDRQRETQDKLRKI